MTIFAGLPRPLACLVPRQLAKFLPPMTAAIGDDHRGCERAAMAAVVRLEPANVGEAMLAARAVAAERESRDRGSMSRNRIFETDMGRFEAEAEGPSQEREQTPRNHFFETDMGQSGVGVEGLSQNMGLTS